VYNEIQDLICLIYVWLPVKVCLGKIRPSNMHKTEHWLCDWWYSIDIDGPVENNIKSIP